MKKEKPALSAAIDKFSVATGRAVAWLTLVMVVVSFVIVIMRYMFDTGFIWLQESLTWMHAAVFMLGAAYTLQCDGHVRVDIFYREMSPRRRALTNLFGVAFFIFPLCVFLVYASLDYVGTSWQLREVSRNSGGLPYPLIPILKSTLIVMPVAVAMQALSLACLSIKDLSRD